MKERVAVDHVCRFGIGLLIIQIAEHHRIAGDLTISAVAAGSEPDKRVEPVKRGEQRDEDFAQQIMLAGVGELVEEDAFELGGRESISKAGWKEDGGCVEAVERGAGDGGGFSERDRAAHFHLGAAAIEEGEGFLV